MKVMESHRKAQCYSNIKRQTDNKFDKSETGFNFSRNRHKDKSVMHYNAGKYVK